MLPISATSGARAMDADELKRLKEAAEIVAEAVRAVSSGISRRIPTSVVVKGDERGLYIQAGGAKAPNAYPFDPPDNPPVYHPLFARRGSRRYTHGKWYAQPYRPFLEIAAGVSIERATEAFSKVIDDWATRVGFTR